MEWEDLPAAGVGASLQPECADSLHPLHIALGLASVETVSHPTVGAGANRLPERGRLHQPTADLLPTGGYRPNKRQGYGLCLSGAGGPYCFGLLSP